MAAALAGWGCTPPGDDDPFEPTLLTPPEDAPLAGLVNPFIGTANDGQTYPGAAMPWGMASPSPHTTLTDPLTVWSSALANAGYLHGAPQIHGFGQTHLSGVGCPDLGAPVLVPTVGEVQPDWDLYGSAYDRETAHAGYYAVRLTDPGVTVEMTASTRVALYRLWFPRRRGDANVQFDVGRSVSWIRDAGWVRVLSPVEAEGRVRGGLFCAESNHPTVYFVARFGRAAVETGTWQDAAVREDAAEASGSAGAFFRFDTRPGEPVEVAIGLSFVSTENARENLEAELGEQTFDEVHDAATRAWQAELGRIQVEGGEEVDRVRFYTALYHALLQPYVASDVNGDFATAEGVGHDTGDDRYTVFSLWDTFRTLHPLLTLVYPERQAAMLRSLAAISAESDLPVKWELVGENLQLMIGDPLPIVVTDSYLKGLGDFDVEGLYLRMRDAAVDPAQRPGIGSYLALGYVPMDEPDVWGPVSTTLEYALADATLALLAGVLGYTEDASEFEARSGAWTHFFEASTGLLRPLNADGSFLSPFDPDALQGSGMQPNAGGPGYVEGTAWHWSFFVPHDIEGLIAIHGASSFVERLQSLFDTDRFAIWNEPTITYPYLFNHLPGEAWRAQKAVRDTMAQYFGDGPDGLPGNDDTGTMSAWFVFSALGIFPDSPGWPRYTIGSPIFSRVTIALDPAFHAGTSFVVEAQGNAPDRPYVTSMTLDGSALASPFLTHDQVTAGGTLTLEMSDTP